MRAGEGDGAGNSTLFRQKQRDYRERIKSRQVEVLKWFAGEWEKRKGKRGRIKEAEGGRAKNSAKEI